MRKKVKQKGFFVSGIFFPKLIDLLQENEYYSSNTLSPLAPLTIPYSQLGGEVTMPKVHAGTMIMHLIEKLYVIWIPS